MTRSAAPPTHRRPGHHNRFFATGDALDEQTVQARARACPTISSFGGSDQTKDDFARIPDERLAAILRPHMEPAR